MPKGIKSILFVACVVLVFTAQTYRSEDKDKQHSNHNQGRPQAQTVREPARSVQNRPQVPTVRESARRESPRRPVVDRKPIAQTHYQSAQQERQRPRVYAVAPVVVVENNNLFHHQHHKNWRPRYNFYDNGYHFYPYVNIAPTVEFSNGYVLVGPDGQNYFYDQGTFYQQVQGGQYVAVPPPVGIIVNPLVANARQIIVDNQVFYRYKGVFYVQVEQGFQVIAPVQYSSDE